MLVDLTGLCYTERIKQTDLFGDFGKRNHVNMEAGKMTQLTRNDITIRKKYMEYFWPTVFTAMGSSIATITDQIIVGNMLGSNALATINLLTPMMQIYFAFSCMLGIGTVTLISHAQGKNDPREANRVYSWGFAGVMLLSAVLMLVQSLFLKPIIHLLSPDPTLRTLAMQYYVPNIVGTPFYFLLSYYAYIVRIDGRPRFSLAALLTSNIVDSLASAGLIALFPQMGITGAAIGTVVGRAVGCGVLLFHYIQRKNEIRFCFGGEGLAASFRRLGLIVKNGISSSMGDLLFFIRLAFLNSFLQVIVPDPGMALVALSVSTSCQVLITAFIVGASDTTVPLVGILLGQKDYDGIRMTLRYAWRTLLIASIGVTVLLEAFPALIAGIFGITSEEELAYVIPAIRICTLGFIGVSATELVLYYLTAIGKSGLALMTSVVKSVALIVPFTLLLCTLMGINGAWWAFVASAYGTLLIVWIAGCITQKRSKGKHSDLYLLEDKEDCEVSYFSITNEPASLSRGIEALHHFMEENQVSPALAYKIAMAVEEMASSAQSIRKEVDMDVRICLMPKSQEIIISIRDNGGTRAPFVQPEEGNIEAKLTETGVLMALAKKIETTTLLGFNQTTLTIGIGEQE